MLKQVITNLTPPIFPADEDKTRKARYAHWIAIFFLGVVIFFETIVRPLLHYTGFGVMDLLLIGIAGIGITGLVLLRKGYVQSTSVMLVALVWAASNGIAATGFGAKDASYILNFAIILMAGLLLGWGASLIITALSILSGLALAFLELSGQIGIGSYPITSFVRDIAIVFGLNAGIIWLLIGGLETALKKSRMSLEELASANATLNYTQNELQNRSSELLVANKELESRTQKLHAIAMVTRTAASIQDFDLLLSSISGTISKAFGYYHVSLFLLDEQKEFAILRSANTPGGQRMLNSRYRVPVGQLSPIGSVAQTGQPRIAFLSSAEMPLHNNPQLPETQSELVLPLKSGDQIIGVLDIQSVEANAFTEEDMSTFSILADQVAITIQNSFLYEQSLTALRKADIASVQATTEAWKGFERSLEIRGYHYDGIKSEPLKDVKQPSKGNNSLLIPIELRGQTIGRFKLNLSDPSRQWTDDELIMVRATAERVALALEGARLLDEAQKRATREAFLSEVATKLSTSFQLDSILRDTVQELGQTLKDSTVTFQLVNPATSSDRVEPKKSNGATPE